MTRPLTCTLLLALSCLATPSPADDPPRFEAADVHASEPSANIRNNYVQGPFVGAGRFDVRRATIVDLIHFAWNVRNDKIVGGPDWADVDRFQILAKAPANSSTADLRLMLQSLLADRFHLKVHDDTRPMPAYALVVADPKRLHLKEASGAGQTGCKPQDSASGPNSIKLMSSGPEGVVTTISLSGDGMIQYQCRNVTMPVFASAISSMIGAGNLGPNPIADDTHIKGAWDFDLKFTLAFNGGLGGGASEHISMPDAVEKQLGLKLEKRDIPMPVTVIDSVDQPTPNPPGLTLNLPPLPTEFDVAAIKPTPPDFRFGNFRPQRGGRVTIEGMNLKYLIQQAWNLFSPDMIVNAPKFTETDRWDIIAKAPTYGPEDDASNAPADISRFQTIDQDSINVMLRNLLIERFKIQYHTEERPSTAFVLTASKLKLKKADPAHRTGYHEGPGPDGKDPRISNPAAARLVTCENMTMKQFAQNLPMLAGGYIRGATVYDETGIEGAFDFTLNFSGAGMVGGGRGGRSGGGETPNGGAPEAADPGSAISLAEALDKQLGLKLTETKRPAQVLVIDRIEPKPIEN